MKITRIHLRRIIREELTRVIREGKCDKASGHEGCIRKREKGWVVLSNKTGECWGRSKKGDDAECTYYDSEEEAKEALGSYHA